MRLFRQVVVLGCLSIGSCYGFAQQGGLPLTTEVEGQGVFNNSMNQIATYLQNLGLYLGYDLTKAPSVAPFTQLLDMATGSQQTSGAGTGATPPDTIFTTILTSFINAATIIGQNPLGQNTTSNNPFLSLFIDPNVDQRYTGSGDSSNIGSGSGSGFAQDPISQAMLDMITTPPNDWAKVYPYNISKETIAQYLFLSNKNDPTQGTIGPADLFSRFDSLLPSLSSNALTTPLAYSQNAGGGSSSQTGADNTGSGNQMLQALNFIRLSASAYDPVKLPSYTDFKNNLNNYWFYLNKLLVVTAQKSVAVSNLYSILSERIPQTQTGICSQSGGPQTQAYCDYFMASRRLSPPPNTQGQAAAGGGAAAWVDQINTASTATVQKEMALLLAEINYQLYLSRQQQERILLTNSMLLLQSTNRAIPSSDANYNQQLTQAGGQMAPAGGGTPQQ